MTNMKTKYKIRFNLSAGNNFMKWKITSPNGDVEFHEPSEVTLVMHGCKLHNGKSTAQKIFDGAHKTVCAWVVADAMSIFPMKTTPNQNDNKVGYNPRVTPNWVCMGSDVDGDKFKQIYTSGNTLLTREE